MDRLLKLYQESISIKELKPLQGLDYHNFINLPEPTPVLSSYDFYKNLFVSDGSSIESFFYTQRFFWIIPLVTIWGNYIGFLVKGYEAKEYRVVTNSKVPVLYGFQNLKGYKKEIPLIVVEGIRDLAYLHQYYSYVVATLGPVSVRMLAILKEITKIIYLGFDNDLAGNRLSFRVEQKLKKEGVTVVRFKPKLKDWGEYFLSGSYEKLFLTQILTDPFLNDYVRPFFKRDLSYKIRKKG